MAHDHHPANAHTKRRRRARKFRRGLERRAEMQRQPLATRPEILPRWGITTAAMSLQDQLAFERLIPERLRFEVTKWARKGSLVLRSSGMAPGNATRM